MDASADPEHHYIRVSFNDELGDPWLSLYELDAQGSVLRHAQMYTEGSRFSPEQILICSPVDPQCLLSHAGAQRLDRTIFETIWADVAPERSFHQTLPDSDRACIGSTRLGPHELKVLWMPDTHAPPGWTCVPGFTKLFVEGGPADARRVRAAAFCGTPFVWRPLQQLSA